MKYKYQTTFKDKVNSQVYTVIVLTKEEAKQIMEERNYSTLGGMYDSEGTKLLFNSTSNNTIAHECWHALESNLFMRRDYIFNLSDTNEHIAYYLGWLVENVTKAVDKLKQQQELDLTKKKKS
jgi:hypothetical protein